MAGKEGRGTRGILDKLEIGEVRRPEIAVVNARNYREADKA